MNLRTMSHDCQQKKRTGLKRDIVGIWAEEMSQRKSSKIHEESYSLPNCFSHLFLVDSVS